MGARQHSPKSLNRWRKQLVLSMAETQLAADCLDRIAGHCVFSMFVLFLPFISLSLKERHANTYDRRTHFVLPMSKSYREREGEEKDSKMEVPEGLLLFLYQEQPVSWGEIGDAVNLGDALYTFREGQVKFSVLPHSGTLPIHFPEVNCISPHPISDVSASVNATEQTGFRKQW